MCSVFPIFCANKKKSVGLFDVRNNEFLLERRRSALILHTLQIADYNDYETIRLLDLLVIWRPKIPTFFFIFFTFHSNIFIVEKKTCVFMRIGLGIASL